MPDLPFLVGRAARIQTRVSEALRRVPPRGENLDSYELPLPWNVRFKILST